MTFSEDKIVYLDNAATTWPKPAEVAAVCSEYWGNPGRGSHRLAIKSGEAFFKARSEIAAFFGCEDPFRLICTQNATMALNQALFGLLKPGDRVLVSPMEHNAVMRPLEALKSVGIITDVLPSGRDGLVDPDSVAQSIRHETRLVCICHESNVNGVIQPLGEIGAVVRNTPALLLADCAQSAGSVPVDLEADNIDLLAFTGHKGLYGPMGTGGLILGQRVKPVSLRPRIYGGTGSNSDKYEQPAFLPDKYESGTQNVSGFCSLAAGINWLKEQGLEQLRQKKHAQVERLIKALREIDGVTVYCADDPERRGSTISVVIDGLDNGEAGALLDSEWNIMSRIGLHCAPAAHRTIGTFPNGTIRFSISAMTSESDFDTCIAACQDLAEQ